MTSQPLTPQKDPLLKHLYAPRRNRMLTELISQLLVCRWRDGGQTVRRIVR